MRLSAAAVPGLILAASAPSAFAAGFYLQEQSVRGLGRAYSGEAADQGPASLWWNPAAIARSPREAYVGAHAVFVDSKVSDQGSTRAYPGGVTLPVGGVPRANDPIDNGVAPNLAVTMPLGERFAVALSLAAPYNFTTEYDHDSWARYDALTSRLTTADFQLTGAFRATDWLDLGVSLNGEYADAKLQTASPNLSPLLPDGVNELKGDGWDWGWSVGAQAHVERLTLGASYRSSIDHKLKGRVFVGGLLGPLSGGNMDVPGRASFSTPWMATASARYRVTDRLTLDGQVQRIGWGEFDAIEVKVGNARQTLAQNYHDVTAGGVGLDYALNEKVTLRAGVQRDPTPTPDDERTARVPDGDRWIYAAGATVRLTPAFLMDAGLGYVDFDASRINHDTVFYQGTPAAVTTRLRGRVTGSSLIGAIGLRATF